MRLASSVVVLLLLLAPAAGARRGRYTLCEKDVKVAVQEVEKQCGRLIHAKEIPWKKIGRAFLKEARKVENETEHYLLLVRLVARLQDGHAYARRTKEGEAEVELPAIFEEKRRGPGMFWCRVGRRIYVKTAWGAAASAGLEAGDEIVRVDEEPVLKWLDRRIETLRDTTGFSTDHAAFASVCHWGLGEPAGTRRKLEYRDGQGKLRKRTLTYARDSLVAVGPPRYLEGLERAGDLRFGRTPAGWGYVHIRRCKGGLPGLMDRALAALGDPRGLILDFRANGGGGFDHEAFMGRFVPEGKTLRHAKAYASAGPRPYGGPIVVIVDGMTLSAGETGSGMFKEDGRAYMIGESPTAGMSSSKTTIPLPSGLFELYVSVRSNMGRFNGSKGIEGIGVPPHEIVEYDPEDLRAGKDTLLMRAEALLGDFPRKQVPYDPEDYGWKPGA